MVSVLCSSGTGHCSSVRLSACCLSVLLAHWPQEVVSQLHMPTVTSSGWLKFKMAWTGFLLITAKAWFSFFQVVVALKRTADFQQNMIPFFWPFFI